MNPEEIKAYTCFRPAWHAFAVYLFGAALFWIGPLAKPEGLISPALGQLIGTLFLAFVLIKRFTCQYRVDGQNVSVETTFPSAKVVSLPIADIRRIDLRRGLSHRLLNVALVHIYSADQAEPVLRLYGVPKPQTFKRLLLELGAGDEKVSGAWRA